MRSYRTKRSLLVSVRIIGWMLPVLVGGLTAHPPLYGQATDQEKLAAQVQKLTESMERAQDQLEQSQRQLNDMRQQLVILQKQMAQSGSTVAAPVSPVPVTSATETASASTAAALDDLREQQSLEESQIATHDQIKVESESKYPVKISGLLLLNGFVNTRQVDVAATPTVAVTGSGSTGASLRQTLLGISATGPHLLGATSYADLSVDFDGSPQSSGSASNYAGYYSSTATLLRLRTAHAGLQWHSTEAYFSLDRPIFSPSTPTSLTAVAQPALAWSGNLWTWNPQVGVTHDLRLGGSRILRLQSALIDVGDAPLSPTLASTTSTDTPPTAGEQSRWPGTEARVAILGSESEGSSLGIGGYFSPHLSPFLGRRFDAWAGTLDAKVHLPGGLEFTGSFYRGAALGGLGGGAYKDFVYRPDADTAGYYFRPLDDVGGWAELKEKVSNRLEFNAAYGIDNAFANELRRYAVPGGTMLQNLARNRTYTGNAIYSPRAYLLFSLEYRHLQSLPISGVSAESNIVGVAAGYKF